VATAKEFDEFVAAHSSTLLRSAYLLTGSWPDAEDAVQVALTRCYRRWRRVDVHLAPAAYVRQAVLHATVDQQRRPWRRERPTAEIPDRATTDPVESSAERLDLVAALQALPARTRAVIVLRYWDDLSVREVADLLDCPQETVRTQAARGLARLRAALDTADDRREASG
jgi:RNA polymerase sigma-70 factor (sigma-E family)